MIAVVGGGGEIGVRLVQTLQARGERCCVIHRGAAPVRLSPSRVDLRRADLRHAGELRDALSGCTTVINLAIDKARSPRAAEAVKANATACANLVGACVSSGVTRFLHVSSIVVLPPRFTTAAVHRPFAYSRETDWYTRAKIRQEQIVRRTERLEACIVRAGVVYGPFMSWSRSAIERCRQGVVFVPEPSAQASWCPAIHVDDAARLLAHLACRSERPPGLLYAVHPERITFHEFFAAHCLGLGLRDRVAAVPLAALEARARGGAPLPRLLRWVQASPLLDGVRDRRTFRALADRARRLTDTPAPSSSEGPARRGLTEFWPSRAELELYRSDAVLSAEQNGVATGFTYRTTLASAGNTIARWSRYELPQLTADEHADLHLLAPA